MLNISEYLDHLYYFSILCIHDFNSVLADDFSAENIFYFENN